MDVMKKGDDPIPAFLVLQFRLIKDTLYVTAFFRAIEVGKHLPINITEICLHCQQIYKKIPSITTVNLAIFATSAYYDKNFNRCTKAEMDYLLPEKIGAILASRNYTKIIELLEEKRRNTSYDLQGINAITNIVEDYTDFYNSYVIKLFKDYKNALEKEEALHKATNNQEKLSKSREKSQEKLNCLIKSLKSEEEKNAS